MNTNDINDLIIEAFLRKIDLSNVESWVRDQANDQSIVLSEDKCVEVVLNWILIEPEARMRMRQRFLSEPCI
jgi:hypothetical protein